ncbi:MAG: MATE family efflux transporter [Clostridiales bacterium]|nr:MATE family efflux transporter [Clostridiales bacterium]
MEEEAKLKSEQRRERMLEGNLIVVIASIAVPMMITMWVDSIYNMADAYYVSQIGPSAIAAVGVNDSLMQIVRSVSMGFGMGSSSFVSRALGAKRDTEASQAAVTTLFSAVGVLTFLAVVASLNLLPVVNFLGATDTVRPYSMTYARWILLSAPIAAADTILSQTLRSEGNTLYSMIGMSAGCVVNIILDPILINRLGMGIMGAAIATDISKLISLCVLLWPFMTKKTVIQIKPRYFTPTKEIYAEIARMGLPTMLRSSMMSVSTILINNTAASFGDATMAAIAVANKSMRMVHSGVMGFGQGFQPVAGYNYGAKNYARVKQAWRYVVTIGITLAIIIGTAIYFFAPHIVGAFSENPEVMAIGMLKIRSQCITLIPHVIVMISSGLFQAMGKAAKAATLGLSRQLLVLIPCVLILPRIFGAPGLACCQSTSDSISFFISLAFVIPQFKELGQLERGEIEAPPVLRTRGARGEA